MEHRFFRGPEGLLQAFVSRLDQERFLVRLVDQEFEVSVLPMDGQRFLLRLPEGQLVVDWARRGRELFLQLEGESYRLSEEDAAQALAQDPHGDAEEPALGSPMPGRVVKLLVKAGDRVTQGQPVLIIDSMKIEFELKASRTGVVERVLAEEGRQVEVGQSLVVLKDRMESRGDYGRA